LSSISSILERFIGFIPATTVAKRRIHGSSKIWIDVGEIGARLSSHSRGPTCGRICAPTSPSCSLEI
jgi:hypothetical protein